MLPIGLAAAYILAGCVADAADFQRDVQPILSEHCAQCHGTDEKERKSGLRLDQRDAALKGGESGTAAIVPGKLDQGELIRRITSTNPDEMMPPPDHKKPLSVGQIETGARAPPRTLRPALGGQSATGWRQSNT